MIYDVIVIGAGQAGLAMGYYLMKQKMNFLILHKDKQIGDVWRSRYDSLILFTPRMYSALPGFQMAGDPHGFPTREEVVEYLVEYAQTFELPIKNETDVKKINKENNIFNINTSKGDYKARQLVVATGPFQEPRIPALAKELNPEILQLHSSEYLRPSMLKEGSVIVVGGGNSGAQIAVELSEGREVYLSVGQNIRYLPLVLLKKSIFWWFDRLGVLKVTRESKVGKWIRSQGDPIFGLELKDCVRKGKVQLKPRTVDCKNGGVLFEDGSQLTAYNIIWATGFFSNYSWLDFKGIFDSSGKPRHQRGVTEIDGLYFLGLPWQNKRGSALLLGVGEDAKYLSDYMKEAGVNLGSQY